MHRLYKVLLCHHSQMQGSKSDQRIAVKSDCSSQAESPTQTSYHHHYWYQLVVHRNHCTAIPKMEQNLLQLSNMISVAYLTLHCRTRQIPMYKVTL